MNKAEFENLVEDWVTQFIESDDNLTLYKTFKNTNLAKISHPILDQMSTAKLCDFNCDFVFLVKDVFGNVIEYEGVFFFCSLGLRSQVRTPKGKHIQQKKLVVGVQQIFHDLQ